MKSIVFAFILMSISLKGQIFITNKPIMIEDTTVNFPTTTEVMYGKEAYYCLIKIPDSKYDLLSKTTHVAHSDNKLEQYKEGYKNAPFWLGSADNKLKILIKIKGEDEFVTDGIVVNSSVDGTGNNYVFIDLLPKKGEKSPYPTSNIANSYTEVKSFLTKIKKKLNTPAVGIGGLKKSAGTQCAIKIEYTNVENKVKTIEQNISVENEGNAVVYGARVSKPYEVGTIPEEYKSNEFNASKARGHSKDELVNALKSYVGSADLNIKYFSLDESVQEQYTSGIKKGEIAGYRIKCLSIYERNGKCLFGTVSFFYKSKNSGGFETNPEISRYMQTASSCE